MSATLACLAGKVDVAGKQEKRMRIVINCVCVGFRSPAFRFVFKCVCLSVFVWSCGSSEVLNGTCQALD